jgi:hypothetical protein
MQRLFPFIVKVEGERNSNAPRKNCYNNIESINRILSKLLYNEESILLQPIILLEKYERIISKNTALTHGSSFIQCMLMRA